MGTKRSKHNKGVKPIYKNVDRDSSRAFDWFRTATDAQLATVPPTRRVTAPIRVDVPLEAKVARYLAERSVPVARPTTPRRGFDVGSRVIEDSRLFAEGNLVSFSRRDILLQMLSERRLKMMQVRAGRFWQRDLEEATIQPCLSIDWSEPRRGMHYQPRGELTERQYAAMKRRRAFIEEAGLPVAAFLDTCLEADRGRAELLQVYPVTRDVLYAAIEKSLDLLLALQGYGAVTGPETEEPVAPVARGRFAS